MPTYTIDHWNSSLYAQNWTYTQGSFSRVVVNSAYYAQLGINTRVKRYMGWWDGGSSAHKGTILTDQMGANFKLIIANKDTLASYDRAHSIYKDASGQLRIGLINYDGTLSYAQGDFNGQAVTGPLQYTFITGTSWSQAYSYFGVIIVDATGKVFKSGWDNVYYQQNMPWFLTLNSGSGNARISDISVEYGISYDEAAAIFNNNGYLGNDPEWPTMTYSPVSADWNMTNAFYTDSQITLTTKTAANSIYYTTDGTLPVIGNAATKLYTGPFTITYAPGSTTVVKAKTAVSGTLNSTFASSTFTHKVAQPTPALTKTVDTAVPGYGLQSGDDAVVTFAPVSPNSEVRYSMDGTYPTATSTLYTGPITLPYFTVQQRQSAYQTFSLVYAVAVNKTTKTLSEIVSAGTGFACDLKVKSDSSVVAYDDYVVPVSTASPQTTIHYTLDGSPPSTSSPQAQTSITVPWTSGKVTLTVQAFNAVLISYPQVVTITFKIPKPSLSSTFSVSNSPVPVTVSVPSSFSAAHYTLDGSLPTLSSPSVINGAQVLVPPNSVLKVATVRNGALSELATSSVEPEYEVTQVRTTIFHSQRRHFYETQQRLSLLQPLAPSVRIPQASYPDLSLPILQRPDLLQYSITQAPPPVSVPSQVPVYFWEKASSHFAIPPQNGPITNVEIYGEPSTLSSRFSLSKDSTINVVLGFTPASLIFFKANPISIILSTPYSTLTIPFSPVSIATLLRITLTESDSSTIKDSFFASAYSAEIGQSDALSASSAKDALNLSPQMSPAGTIEGLDVQIKLLFNEKSVSQEVQLPTDPPTTESFSGVDLLASSVTSALSLLHPAGSIIPSAPTLKSLGATGTKVFDYTEYADPRSYLTYPGSNEVVKGYSSKRKGLICTGPNSRTVTHGTWVNASQDFSIEADVHVEFPDDDMSSILLFSLQLETYPGENLDTQMFSDFDSPGYLYQFNAGHHQLINKHGTSQNITPREERDVTFKFACKGGVVKTSAVIEGIEIQISEYANTMISGPVGGAIVVMSSSTPKGRQFVCTLKRMRMTGQLMEYRSDSHVLTGMHFWSEGERRGFRERTMAWKGTQGFVVYDPAVGDIVMVEGNGFYGLDSKKIIGAYEADVDGLKSWVSLENSSLVRVRSEDATGLGGGATLGVGRNIKVVEDGFLEYEENSMKRRRNVDDVSWLAPRNGLVGGSPVELIIARETLKLNINSVAKGQ